jgi:DNA-directed RNA polymerase specialized sigma24 family protein
VEDRPPQEAQLVTRAKRGEPGAYEEIVRMHQTIAFRTAWVITRSSADAEEAAQDAFLKAHAALGRFRDGAPFRPWLLAIVANEARNRLRSAGRRAGLVQRVAEERRPDDAVPSPEAALRGSAASGPSGSRARRTTSSTAAPGSRSRSTSCGSRRTSYCWSMGRCS